MLEEQKSRQIYRARIERAITYINNNLSAELDLAHMAGVAGFSPFHFHRIFVSTLGETPHNFIQRLRLERAANLLSKSPALPITRISFDCGFSSPAVFARAFKARFGLSASAYRQTNPAALPSIQSGGRQGQNHNACRAALEQHMANSVQVKDLPEWHVLYVPNLEGYSLPKICRAWNRLHKWASARGLITSATRAIGISFDDPAITPENKCRYYACLSLPEKIVDPGGSVGVLRIAGGRHAVARMECKAEEIQSAYHYLYNIWLPESGCQPADQPCYEIYHTTPENHPSGKFVMEICIPIEPL